MYSFLAGGESAAQGCSKPDYDAGFLRRRAAVRGLRLPALQWPVEARIVGHSGLQV